MANDHLGAVVRHLHRLAGSPPAEELCDGQLLERFALGGEEAAFAALVRRHGPMVLGVCRRVLRHGGDAEDAFQATFLVLFRRARSLRRNGSLANYLYTVAYHVALKAKAEAARRRRCEKEVRDMPRAPANAADLWNDLRPVLDEELNRLPRHYRATVVLCYLQGKTNDEAARLLGCASGTVKSRLARARDLLRTRLARRGVALATGLLGAALAEHAAAAVPPTLARAAVQATVLAAAGQAPAAAASLADSVLKAMFVTKLTTATAVLLALGTLLLAAVVWTRPPEGRAEEVAGTESPPAAKEGPRPEPKEPAKPDGPTMTVRGRVLDAEGKPLSGAEVAVCGRQGMLLSSAGWWTAFRNEVLGQTKSDTDGTYRLTVPRTDVHMTYRTVRVVAAAAGHGLAWKALDPDAEPAEAELRLGPVQRVSGHLVGLQGEGAAAVTIHVARLTRPPAPGERDEDAAFRPPEGLALAVTTDDKGDFVFRGFGPGAKLELEIRDPRYERKDGWLIDTADRKQTDNVRLLLAPGRYVEGRVIYQDTGKPVPHARLTLHNPIIEASTDAEGRFTVPLYSPRDGDALAFLPRDVHLSVYAPPGEPYVGAGCDVDFPRGVVKRQVELVLPRAALVRGRVTEAGSGKPVAGAYVADNGTFDHSVASGPDGSFRLGVSPGGVRLYVAHPSGEFIPRIVGSGGGTLDKPVGDPYYFHAVLDVDVKKDDRATEVNVTLRRGTTIKGRLVGPDGKPIASAVLFVSSHRPRFENTMHPVHVRGGRFEVRGLDPDKAYRLLFLEHPRLPGPMITPESLEGYSQLYLKPLLGAANKLGMSVEVCPKKVNEELTVKLAPCGKALVRLVDGAGQPLANYAPWLQLVVTPGPRIFQALQEKTLAAEVVSLTGRYGGEPDDLRTDAGGRVTFEGLIPGATYRLKKTHQEPNNEVLKDFSAEAGKTVELEVVVK
jgi:RNA polymerase sigma factor (sigma-70 family)